MADHERPFEDLEKFSLLFEVIRTTTRPDRRAEMTVRLASVVNEFDLHPDLTLIALPAGRHLQACQRALAELGVTSQSALTQPYEAARYSQSQPYVSHQSSSHPVEAGAVHYQRPLQPRPEGYAGPSQPYVSSYARPTPDPMAGKRKRGRPSNREREERRQAAMASGSIFSSTTASASPKRARASLPAGFQPVAHRNLGPTSQPATTLTPARSVAPIPMSILTSPASELPQPPDLASSAPAHGPATPGAQEQPFQHIGQRPDYRRQTTRGPSPIHMATAGAGPGPVLHPRFQTGQQQLPGPPFPSPSQPRPRSPSRRSSSPRERQ